MIHSNRKYACLRRTGKSVVMHHRLFTGSRADLRDRMALIMPSSHPDMVFAQFDIRSHNDMLDPMCFMWHLLPAICFKSRRVRR